MASDISRVASSCECRSGKWLCRGAKFFVGAKKCISLLETDVSRGRVLCCARSILTTYICYWRSLRMLNSVAWTMGSSSDCHRCSDQQSPSAQMQLSTSRRVIGKLLNAEVLQDFRDEISTFARHHHQCGSLVAKLFQFAFVVPVDEACLCTQARLARALSFDEPQSQPRQIQLA